MSKCKCGRKKSYKASMCRMCYYATLSLKTCEKCGTFIRSKTKSLCKECYSKRAASKLICPKCGNRKNRTSKQCSTCYHKSLTFESHKQGRLWRAKVFKLLLLNEDVEWTPQMLSEWTGISTSAIRNWMAGKSAPRAVELAAVAKVLELEVCPNCNGLGYVEPKLSVVNLIKEQHRGLSSISSSG